MHVYFAGATRVEEGFPALQHEVKKRLLSYYYQTPSLDKYYYEDERHNYTSIILDSGAFSAWSKGAVIDINKYIKYALQWQSHVDYIVNLDVIPASPKVKVISPAERERSASEGYINCQRMLDAGISKDKLIHVFHQGEDVRWLVKMVHEDKLPYIGLSPANNMTVSEKMKFLDLCMPYVTDSSGKTIVNFHGFAVTSYELMKRYPWKSVDSITGDAMLFIKEAGRIRVTSIESLYWASTGEKVLTGDSTTNTYKKLHDIEVYVPDIEGNGVWISASKIIRHEVSKKLHVLTTIKGRRLTLTDDHGVFIKKEDTQLCTPTSEVAIGDHTVGVNYKGVFGKLQELTIDTDSQTFQSGDSKADSTHRKLPYKVVFTDILLKFFGLWIANGSYTSINSNATVSISCGDLECIQVCNKIASQFEVACTTDNEIDHSINSSFLVNAMRSLGFKGTPYSKEIPWWVFELPKNKIACFLSGYFSGDSSISKCPIICSTINRKLLYSIHALLSMFNIDVNIVDSGEGITKTVVSKSECNQRNTHEIAIIDAMSLSLFISDIGFIQVHRNDKIVKYLNKLKPQDIRDTCNNSETYLKVTEHNVSEVQNRYVYDLEVPGVERFVANGLLVHNSSTWAVAGGRGEVFTPHHTNGEMDFTIAPRKLAISQIGGKEDHYITLMDRNSGSKRIEYLLKYLDFVNVSIGCQLFLRVHKDYVINKDNNFKKCSNSFVDNMKFEETHQNDTLLSFEVSNGIDINKQCVVILYEGPEYMWVEHVIEKGILNYWKERQRLNAIFLNTFVGILDKQEPRAFNHERAAKGFF